MQKPVLNAVAAIKKPIYLRMWFIVLMIVALAFAVRTVNIAANERKHENAGYGILVLDDGSTTTAKRDQCYV